MDKATTPITPILPVNQYEINNIPGGLVIRSVGRFSCWRRFANDASEYKNYLLVMLFVKYVSDSWTEHYEQLQVQYGDDKERILLRLERERFVLPPDCRFDDVYTKRNDTNLGEVINKALEQIEEANKLKLAVVRARFANN